MQQLGIQAVALRRRRDGRGIGLAERPDTWNLGVPRLGGRRQRIEGRAREQPAAGAPPIHGLGLGHARPGQDRDADGRRSHHVSVSTKTPSTAALGAGPK